MARLFISQERLDHWSSEGKATLAGDVMTLPALGRSFRLHTAYHMIRLSTEGDDTHGLLGKVKTEAQLTALGAELLGSSIVLDEMAYDCEPGFLGEVIGAASSPAGSSVS